MWGRVSELIEARMERGESWGVLKTAGGTLVQGQALCLLAVGWASRGGRVHAEPWWCLLLPKALLGFVHPLQVSLGPPVLCEPL